MIKTILISALSVGVMCTTTAQEKFTTNKGAKEVTELNTSMKDIQFTTTLPSISKYETIISVIDRKNTRGNDYYRLNAYYHEISTKEIASNKKLTINILNSDGSKSDFTSRAYSNKNDGFEIMYSQNDDARTHQFKTVVVKVMGKYQNGYKWEDNKQVPNYEYDELSYTEIQLDLGAPSSTVTSEDGVVTYTKYLTGSALPDWVKLEEDVKIVYREDDTQSLYFYLNEVVLGEAPQEQTMDMSGGPAKATTTSLTNEEVIASMKLNLKKSLVKSSNYKEARSVKYTDGPRFMYSDVLNGVYEPFMLDGKNKPKSAGLKGLKSIGKQFGGGSGSNDKYNKFVNDAESDLKWESKTFGDWNCEVLKLDLYDKKQIAFSYDPIYALKDGEQGNTQVAYLIIGEKNGKVYQAAIFKDEKEAFTAGENAFIEDLFKSISLN